MWSILRILVRYHWIAHGDASFVVVGMVLDPSARVWPFVLVLIVRPGYVYVLLGRVFAFVGIL